MIVWINGPFGVGKSSVANAIIDRRPDATLFDPELIGYLLRRWQPEGVEIGDFQSLSTWRRLVVEASLGLIRDFQRPLIVPMTLLEAAYFDEIVGGIRDAGVELHHYCLVASREDVLRRVAKRGDSGEWFPTKYDEYAASLTDPRFDRRIDASCRSAEEIAEGILASFPPPTE